MQTCFSSNFQGVPLSCCPSDGLCTFSKLLPSKFPQMQWLKTGLIISRFPLGCKPWQAPLGRASSHVGQQSGFIGLAFLPGNPSTCPGSQCHSVSPCHSGPRIVFVPGCENQKMGAHWGLGVTLKGRPVQEERPFTVESAPQC